MAGEIVRYELKKRVELGRADAAFRAEIDASRGLRR